MENLTGKNISSLKEAYAAVYDNDLRTKLEEDREVKEFSEFINLLIDEGYDLSEYTYDDLYEYYISEGKGKVVMDILKGAAQKYGPRALGTIKRGAKEVGKIPVQGTKNIVKGILKPFKTKIGSAAATIAGIEALAAGEKSLTRKALGKGGEAVSALGKAIYGDDKSSPQVASPKPPKPKKEEPKPLKILGGKVVGYDHFDPFDVIKGHLLDEGYADSEEAALAIMANMSEEWKQKIINNN